MSETVYDVVGVGLGPFNLGLAALLDGLDRDVSAAFLEQDDEFAWHEGLLIEGTTLEVPFLADLVTMLDPTSEYSYLNYLREHDRIYEFYTFREFEIPRREYNEYCRWVSTALDSCRFSRRVVTIDATDGHYRVVAEDPTTGDRFEYLSEHVVVGVGSTPYVPEAMRGLPPADVFHTASYLDRRERCLEADHVTVVGSGQSAAEVFEDLLDHQSAAGYHLDWITRSDGFFQLEGSKLAHHLYTPGYVDYFYDLSDDTREQVLTNQQYLYKGIDKDTSDSIFDTLYRRSIRDTQDVALLATTSVEHIELLDTATGPVYRLSCHERQQDRSFTHTSEVVVLATGYHRPVPTFLAPIESRIQHDSRGQFALDREYRLRLENAPGDIFVQNAGLHTHGMNTAHLGLGSHRNAVIANTIVDDDAYPTGYDVGFQRFGVDEFLAAVDDRSFETDAQATYAPPSN